MTEGRWRRTFLFNPLYVHCLHPCVCVCVCLCMSLYMYVSGCGCGCGCRWENRWGVTKAQWSVAALGPFKLSQRGGGEAVKKICWRHDTRKWYTACVYTTVWRLRIKTAWIWLYVILTIHLFYMNYKSKIWGPLFLIKWNDIRTTSVTLNASSKCILIFATEFLLFSVKVNSTPSAVCRAIALRAHDIHLHKFSHGSAWWV